MLDRQTGTPVPRFIFDRSDLIKIGAVSYLPRRSDRDGHALERVDGDTATGLIEAFSNIEIATMIAEGKLRRFPRHNSPENALGRNRHGELRVRDLPEHEQRETNRRVDYCDRFRRMEQTMRGVSRSEIPMQLAIDRIKADIEAAERDVAGAKSRNGKERLSIDAPSPTRLRHYLRLYEDSGFDLMSLRPGKSRSGNRKPRVCNDSIDYALEFANGYLSRNKPCMASCHRAYDAELELENQRRGDTGEPALVKLSPTAFKNRIRAFPEFAKTVGRRGIEEALLEHAFTHGGQRITRPLELVGMDEWTVTLQTLLMNAGLWSGLSKGAKRTVERSRTWLTVALDGATRCILGMRLLVAPPNGDSATSTLEMAVFPKDFLAQTAGVLSAYIMCGVMERVITDSGAGLISNQFKSAIRSLGGTKLLPPAKLPYLRGQVERVFGTIRTQLIAMFPGQTFENILIKGDYDAEGNAAIDVEELNRTLIRYVVDIYHHLPHRGLGGATPYNEWLRLRDLYGVLPPPDDERRREIFGLQLHRSITGRGIKVLGLHYNSRTLQQIGFQTGKRPVLTQVNRHDLGTISVWHDKKWTAVPCVFSDAKGVSYWEWIATAESLRRKNADMTALKTHIVRASIRDIRKFADMVIKRAEIGQPVLTFAAFRKAERALFKTFDFADRPIDGEFDLLADDDLNQPSKTTNPEATAVPAIPVRRSDIDVGYGDESNWRTEDTGE